MKRRLREIFYNFSAIILGSFLTALGLVIFLVPNRIASGGVSGLATVIHYIFHYRVGLTIFLINLPLYLISVRILGKYVGIKTLWGIFTLSLFTDFLTSRLPVLTSDPVLACIYGGLLAGLGMGIVFRAGGTTGGTDLVAALINYYLPRFSIGQGLFIVDVLIVLLAGVVFSAELALYASISIFIQSRVIDFVQEGFDLSKAAIIISSKSDLIRSRILKEMNRGITVLKGYGGYSNEEKLILLVTLNRSELSRLKGIIHDIDSEAFVILTNVHEVIGEGFKEIKNFSKG